MRKRFERCTHSQTHTKADTRNRRFFVIQLWFRYFCSVSFSHPFAMHTYDTWSSFFALLLLSLSCCVCIKYSLEQNHFTTLNSIMSDFAMCSICHLLGMFFSSRSIRRFCRISFRLVGKSVERRHKCIFNSPFSISIYCFDHWKLLMDENWLFEWRRAQNHIELSQPTLMMMILGVLLASLKWNIIRFQRQIDGYIFNQSS